VAHAGRERCVGFGRRGDRRPRVRQARSAGAASAAKVRRAARLRKGSPDTSVAEQNGQGQSQAENHSVKSRPTTAR
jgi:hypothetical protein